MMPLFVCGRLRPGEKMFRHISHTVRSALPATISGRLFDTPFGYPLLVAPGGEEDPPVSGVLLIPRDGLYEEMLRIVETIEGEAGCVKGEMTVTLEGGRRHAAIVYFHREAPPYARPLCGMDEP